MMKKFLVLLDEKSGKSQILAAYLQALGTNSLLFHGWSKATLIDGIEDSPRQTELAKLPFQFIWFLLNPLIQPKFQNL